MSSQDRSFERVNQKRRTRAELLRSARAIIEGGGNPSVPDAADAAGISRATAYRYFSTADDMIREAVLDGVATGIGVERPANDADDATVGLLLDKLVSDVFGMILDNEAVFRAMLGTSVNCQNKNRRGGRRISWLRDTLSPLEDRLSQAQFQRLVHSLSLVLGIESVIVMRDICELEPKDAEQVLRFTARAVLASALADPDRKAS